MFFYSSCFCVLALAIIPHKFYNSGIIIYFIFTALEIFFGRSILFGSGLKSKMGFALCKKIIKIQLQSFTIFILRGLRCSDFNKISLFLCFVEYFI